MTELTSKAQYDWAVARVEEILREMDRHSVLKEPEARYGNRVAAAETSLEIELKLLSDLVADYSEKNYSVGTPTLIEMIALRQFEMGLTGKDLAELIGVSPSRISEYLSGKCEPTLKIAREISRKLDIDPAIVLGV